MGYIGQAPANKVVTSADIEDGVVSAADLGANSVDSSELVNGSVDLGHLSASGTASSSTFLRGDNSWVAAGGDLSFGGDTFGADKTIGANDAYALSLETSGNVAMKIDALGHVTKPLQPACMFALADSDTDTTGDGTTVTVGGTDGAFTEIFDVNGDLGATAVFTAPVTGYYQVSGSINLKGFLVGHTDLQINAAASNRSHLVRIKPADIADGYASSVCLPYSCLLDMDANDTLSLTYRVRGGDKVIDPGNGGLSTVYLVA